MELKKVFRLILSLNLYITLDIRNTKIAHRMTVRNISYNIKAQVQKTTGQRTHKYIIRMIGSNSLRTAYLHNICLYTFK